MSDTCGFGILGAGLVSPFHAKAVMEIGQAELVAICDMDASRADAMATEYGAKAYYSLDEMLGDPAIEVVNVCTPNHLHRDAVVACARAGRHVITEKPPAMSLREVDDMIAACDAAGVQFACTVQCRVRHAIQAMKTAIDGGRFGRLLHADAYMKWFRSTEYYHSDAWRSSRQSGAGVTVQHAFHYIDLLQYLMGQVASVDARMTNLNHPSVKLEDTLRAFVTYANGAQGVVQASTALWPGTDVRIEINGTDGTAIMVGERMATWQFADEQPGDAEMRELGDAGQATGAASATGFGHQDHKVVIANMIDAIRTGAPLVIPAASVRPTVELALAMYQSAARNAPVQLPIEDDPSIWE